MKIKFYRRDLENLEKRCALSAVVSFDLGQRTGGRGPCSGLKRPLFSCLFAPLTHSRMSWTRPWRRDTEASSTAPIEKIDGNTAEASNTSVLDVYTSTIASLGRTVLI